MNDIATASVIHHPEQQRFSLTMNEGEAVLNYRLSDYQPTTGKPTRIDFTHTWVPPELRGKGLAEKLVREGLQWARVEGLAIQASCWYVAKFLRSTDKP